jgi:Pyridoxamine 5'-phosphate oxidase
MAETGPVGELDARFSGEGTRAADWRQARQELEEARLYWLSTVRPDGRPYVTPLIAVWLDGALYFSTGPNERKALNLSANPHCVLVTGCNTFDEGFDTVVEGESMNVTDDAELKWVAEMYVSMYGSDWHFDVRDGAFFGEGGAVLVYMVEPSTVFGFGKGEFTQTRWRFGP